MSKTSDEQDSESEASPYRVLALPREMDRRHFACGRKELDAYFHTQVGQDSDRGFGACFVAVHEETQTIAGFYTLAPCSVAVDQVPMTLSRRLPRYNTVPCVLMGRLAVAIAHQKKDLGEALLIDAWKRARASEIGGYAMVVDAKDDPARAFYERYGFISCRTEPLKLFISLRKDVPTKQSK